MAPRDGVDFNSHAHVERDGLQGFCDYKVLQISTHTLTWSVTRYNGWYFFVETLISTHTLTWSVTFCIPASTMALAHFNSHAHVERD